MRAVTPARFRRLWGEVALFAAAGVVMAMLGPYQTYQLPTWLRLAYWTTCLVGGGLIGSAIDATLTRSVPDTRLRVLAAAVAMTTPVTIFVFAVGTPLGIQPPTRSAFIMLLWQVFVVSLPIMIVRALAWRSPRTIVETAIETRVVVERPFQRRRRTSGGGCRRGAVSQGSSRSRPRITISGCIPTMGTNC